MKKSRIIQATAMTLAVVIAATTFFAYFRVPASAAMSLSNIETIKNKKDLGGNEFKIVEIAPSTDTTAFGYYVSNQESPLIKNWKENVTKISVKEERQKYVDGILQKLETNGLIPTEANKASQNANYPLQRVGNYTEVYPWASNFASLSSSGSLSSFVLDDPETFMVKGEYREAAKGAYTVDSAYYLAYGENIFDMNKWDDDRINHSTWASETTMGASNGSFETSYTNSSLPVNTAVFTTKTLWGSSIGMSYTRTSTNIRAGYNQNDFPKLNISPDTKYTISFDLELVPDEAGKPMKAALDYTIYNGINTIIRDKNYEYTQSQHVQIKVDKLNTSKYMAFTFGAGGNGKAYFKNIQVYKEGENAEYVQDIEYFGYGIPEDEFGGNLFSYEKWSTNELSSVLNDNAHENDTITYSNNEFKTTLKTDSASSGNPATSVGSSPDYYFINVKPSTTYKISYGTQVKSGTPKVSIYEYGSQFALVKTSTITEATENVETSFTTEANTLYIQIAIGAEAPDTEVSISNISINEKLNNKYYYYDVIPTSYSYTGPGSATPNDGDAVYTLDEEGHYNYQGNYFFDGSGVTLQTGITYYTLEVNESVFPSENFSDIHPYFAVSLTFEPAVTTDDKGNIVSEKTAFFERKDSNLTYVGAGNGTHTFIPNQLKPAVPVTISEISYIGGFINNDWFRYKVLEVEKNSDGTDKYVFPIGVKTVTPDDPELESLIMFADLIVIDSGLNINGTAGYGFTSDIPADDLAGIQTALTNYVDNKMPVLVDASLASSTATPSNLKLLITRVLGTKANGVDRGIYYYKKEDNSSSNLANRFFFNTALTSSGITYTNTSSPYYKVYEEIKNENEIRKLQGTDLLDQSTVTEATTIRYIINYQNQRIYDIPTKLKVLDIEPQTSNASITWKTIADLLPASYGYDKDTIEIIPMAVSEFVAKNDDFSETYDIIYIGSSVDNMHTIQAGCQFKYIYTDNSGNKQTALCTVDDNGVFDGDYLVRKQKGQAREYKIGDPVYNDENMIGMYYTNVGDKITTAEPDQINRPSLGGLLSEDYFNIGDDLYSKIPDWLEIGAITDWARTVNIAYGGHAVMRTSGNDLNEAACERLMDFANSGRPVILANEFADAVDEQLTVTMSVIGQTSTDRGYALNLKAEISDATSDILKTVPKTFTWKWSEDGVNWRTDGFTKYTANNKTDWSEVTTPSSALTVSNLRQASGKDKHYYDFDVGGAYFKCDITLNYGGKNLQPINSNMLHVTKKNGQFTKFTLTMCQPGGKGKDFRINLRNGNLSDDGTRPQCSYENYYQLYGFEGVTPRFMTIYTAWQRYSLKWRDADKGWNIGYNHAIDDVQVGPDSKFALKSNLSNTVKFWVYHEGNLVNKEELENGKMNVVYKESGKTKGLQDYVHHKTNNCEFVYYMPKFNWTPEPATPTRITLDPELVEGTIDNCSFMWRFISTTFYSHDNVFSLKEASGLSNTADSTILAKALKIARPELEWITDLTTIEYPNTLKSRTLQLQFYINDFTNPDPLNARYEASCYIDKNGDGKFTEDERQEQRTATLTQYQISTRDKKVPCTYRTTLSDTIKGIISWKLLVKEILPSGATREAGHVSYTGYSYIKPGEDDAIEINALMVLPGAWTHEYRNIKELIKNRTKIDMAGKEKIVKDNWWSENEYIGNVFESDVFNNLENLKRMTSEQLGVVDDGTGIGGTGADGLYHMGFIVNGGDIKINIAVWNVHEMNAWFHSDTDKGDFFEPYNMLILGFGDSWGKMTRTVLDVAGASVIYQEGLQVESAQAIENFIASGRSTLFCHDTTNNSCVFIDYWLNNIAGSALNVWNTVANFVNKWLGTSADTVDSDLNSSKIKQGYWNNIVLREVLGLDRYGITYAINRRAQAIAEGKDPENTAYANADKNRYTNKVIGRAHMYNVIYGYPYAKDAQGENYLTVPNMYHYTDTETTLEHNHSIAWVPGTAITYDKNANGKPDTVQSTAVQYEKHYIYTDSETGKQRILTDAEYAALDTKELAKVRYDYAAVTKHDVTVYKGQPVYDSYGFFTDAGELNRGATGAQYDRYTQGFTDYTITRYIDPNGDNELYVNHGQQYYPSKQLMRGNRITKPTYFDTNKITQVNRGKITTYPYDINIDDLDTISGMNRQLDIAKTHEQVYQCNMNGDDITVWYCLSGNDYYTYKDGVGLGIRNNAANSYYIYSRKNMTYTGAGHTNTFTEVEAKLFINTLISAYRESIVAPTPSFVDSKDTSSNIKYLFVRDSYITENNEDKETVELVNADMITFSVQDKNTGSNKDIVAKFYILDESGNQVDITNDIILYRYKNGNEYTQTSVSAFRNVDDLNGIIINQDVTYAFALPKSVIDKFLADEELNSITIYYTATTRVYNQDSYGSLTGGYQDMTSPMVELVLPRIELSDLA